MAAVTGTGASISSATITGLVASTPNSVSNTTLVTANTEVGIALPANTVRFKLKARNGGTLQVAYGSTESGTAFWTIYPGDTLEETAINAASLTIYVQSPKAGEIVEISTWS